MTTTNVYINKENLTATVVIVRGTTNNLSRTEDVFSIKKSVNAFGLEEVVERLKNTYDVNQIN